MYKLKLHLYLVIDKYGFNYDYNLLIRNDLLIHIRLKIFPFINFEKFENDGRKMIYDHHLWSSFMIIIYDHPKMQSKFDIIYILNA